MATMNREQAEYLIAYLRLAVNSTYAERSRSRTFIPEDHNLCVAYLEFRGGTHAPVVLCSYSAAASVPKGVAEHLKQSWAVEFVPDVPDYLRTYNCQGMGQFHTEPRLLNFIFCSPGYLENIADITLVTEIDCCKTCVSYTIDYFKKKHAGIGIYTIELGMNPGRGVGPQYTMPGLL